LHVRQVAEKLRFATMLASDTAATSRLCWSTLLVWWAY